VNWHKPFGVHDVEVADVDGDGRPDMLTMSDKNNLRWYRIASRRHSYNTKVHFTAQHLHLVLVARNTGE